MSTMPMPLKLVDAMHLTWPSGERFHVTAHADRHECFIFLNNCSLAHHGEPIQAIAAGDVYYKAQQHFSYSEASPDEPVELLLLSWQGGDNVAYEQWPAVMHDHRGLIRSLAGRLIEPRKSCSSHNGSSTDVLLQAIVAECDSLRYHQEDDLLQRIAAYVRTHLSDSIVLEELAALCRWSKFHFCHWFREATGETPMHYVRRQRVEAARMLLLHSDLPMKDIARFAGFADVFHMSRLFRQLLHTSPGALRRAEQIRARRR